jgi:DNA-directed RNA polymerase specialized sigma subunit
MPKKGKKKNYYFTQHTEDAIVAYCATEDMSIRSQLYVEQIQPAFNELVDKIVYTYKFTSLENVDVLKDECKIWLTTILSKFDPSQGTKAFSYFSVVTKNWFTHKAKKQTQKNRREINYDSMIREIETITEEKSKGFVEEEEERQFWEILLKEVKGWQSLTLKENEQKVLDAVLTLLENIESIEIFNKKAIYLYMREITGLNTKQIVSCLNKMRIRYRNFKRKWDCGEIK